MDGCLRDPQRTDRPRDCPQLVPKLLDEGPLALDVGIERIGRPRGHHRERQLLVLKPAFKALCVAPGTSADCLPGATPLTPRTQAVELLPEQSGTPNFMLE